MFYAANFQQEQRESLTVLCQRGRATSLFLGEMYSFLWVSTLQRFYLPQKLSEIAARGRSCKLLRSTAWTLLLPGDWVSNKEENSLTYEIIHCPDLQLKLLYGYYKVQSILNIYIFVYFLAKLNQVPVVWLPLFCLLLDGNFYQVMKMQCM